MVKKKFAYLILISSILFFAYFIYDTYKLVNNKPNYNYEDRKEELTKTNDQKLKMEISDYNYSSDIGSLFLKSLDGDISISYLYAFESQKGSCDNITDDLLKIDDLRFRLKLEKIEENQFKIKSAEIVIKDSLDNKFLLSSIPSIKDIVELSLENGENIILLNLQWNQRYIIGKLPYQICK